MLYILSVCGSSILARAIPTRTSRLVMRKRREVRAICLVLPVQPPRDQETIREFLRPSSAKQTTTDAHYLSSFESRLLVVPLSDWWQSPWWPSFFAPLSTGIPTNVLVAAPVLPLAPTPNFPPP